MKFVKDEFYSSIEEKKSKFIAYLFPYILFNEKLKILKTEHPKARHFVYAYRFVNEFEQIVENSSDDGEPKGTSGKPVLSVLSGADIVNSAVIVVRYFGGTKLGTGGLVRAYSDSVNEAVKIANFYEYKKLATKIFECSYNNFSKIEYFLSSNNILIKQKEFESSVKFSIEATAKELEFIENEILKLNYS